MKFHMWYRTEMVKGCAYQYFWNICFLTPSQRLPFFLHCFTYNRWLPVNFWIRTFVSAHLLYAKLQFIRILKVHSLLNMFQYEVLLLLTGSDGIKNAICHFSTHHPPLQPKPIMLEKVIGGIFFGSSERFLNFCP